MDSIRNAVSEQFAAIQSAEIITTLKESHMTPDQIHEIARDAARAAEGTTAARAMEPAAAAAMVTTTYLSAVKALTAVGGESRPPSDAVSA